jgi:two-component system response regulator ResD
MASVLIVEDDETVAGVLVSYLERAGHRAKHVSDGRAGLEIIESDRPDLVVLDLMLPIIDGLEVCRRVRRRLPDLPIVMLTALGEAEDRIAGLEIGADDYITKPFSPREIILRIEALLRRAGAADPSTSVLSAGAVTLDKAAKRVSRHGQEIALTVREMELLAFLMANADVAFTREQLMREVWGWTFGDNTTVTVHVRRLREKVEDDPANPTLIKTVWGVGYRLEMP